MPLDVNLALAAVGAGLAMGIAAVGSGIGVGITGAAGATVISESPEKFGVTIVFSALPQTQAIYGLLTAILILLGTGLITKAPREGFSALMAMASLGAGIAVGMAGLSAIGQGIAAASGIGATSENPEVFGKGMVFSVLPETQAIYGLLTAILLLVFAGIIGTMGKAVSTMVGLATIGAGASVGLAGLSGIGQGITAASGIGAAAKEPATMGKSIVLAVMSETFAIFGLLIALLIMYGTGLFG